MRILLVEDEPEIIDFLKPSLQAECYAVDVVSEGEKASYFGRTGHHDLIILDCMLPKKNGQQICREIRQAGKSMPIIVLSKINDIDNKISLLEAGADDYMVKPFSLEELLSRIKALLRRPHRINDEIIQISDVILDTGKNRVTKNSQPVRLTKKEFMLLQYLMINKGAVLSRGKLLEHVWDMNADPFSNTIESHILSLRRKIENKKTKQKIIFTIPGRGYMIDDQAYLANS
ncbi:MAG: DNA-binding response regulator [Candidatus Magasanikbacteria bacterium CG10_big_fil_rev_8_21_14_0_10_40_10]|uniref:DNA-binding response regulator n=1 Tax=Candidatus Magasanikbacteria bacterium CG10_big_fil_rev_8_21_14_0_10_40_10 TaxID=1974648 RepID=A0A2M6W2X3_9BACT|nr:MAG: DNA-binding response regulator [Candidatus Magasanikbacteria bacterium CG10_big_fil_rev_8_21_14_0_10_40_10]